MALKRAAAPETTTTETTQSAAAEVVKETVKEVEANAAATTTEQPKDAAADTNEADNAALENQSAAEPEPAAEQEAAAQQVKEAQVKETKPTAEVEPETVATREAAVKPEGTAVVTNAERQANASEQFTKSMAEQGYEGLAITGMSFDRLKLHEAKFQLGSEETSLGEQIDVVVLSTRPIYVVRQYPGEGAEMFYSYDKQGKTLSDGTSAQDTLDKWLDEGYGTADDPLDIKEYIEAMSQLVNRDDEYSDHMVSLSIPPASKARLAGAMAVGLRKFACSPADLVIRCSVGKKVGTGDKAFRPWNFSALGDQNVLAAAE